MIQKVFLYTGLLLKLSYKSQYILHSYLFFCLLSFLFGFSEEWAEYKSLMLGSIFIYSVMIILLDSGLKNDAITLFKEIHGIRWHISRLSKFLLVNLLFLPFGISRINEPYIGLYYVGIIYFSAFSVSFLCPFAALVLAGVLLFFIKTGAAYIFILSYLVSLAFFTFRAKSVYK